MKIQFETASERDLIDLLNSDQPAATLVTAAPENPADPNKIRISLKNAIREAREQIEQIFKDEDTKPQPLLTTLHDFEVLNEDESVWKGCPSALTIFVFLDGSWQVYSTEPCNNDGKGLFGAVPYLRTLWQSLLTVHEIGQILEVSKDQIRFYDFLFENLEEQKELSATIQEILVGYEAERSLQHHTSSKGGEAAAKHHGHGQAGDSSVQKLKAKAFFQKWASEMEKELSNLEGLTVLAGTDTYVNLFRDTVAELRYANFTLPPLSSRNSAELKQLIREKMNAEQLQKFETDFEVFRSLSPEKRHSNDLKVLVDALQRHQVQTLFLDREFENWKSVPSELTETGSPIRTYKGETTEVGDLLLKMTLKQGGTVIPSHGLLENGDGWAAEMRV